MSKRFKFEKTNIPIHTKKVKLGKNDILCWDNQTGYAGTLCGEGIEWEKEILNIDKIDFVPINKNENGWKKVEIGKIDEVKLTFIAEFAKENGFIVAGQNKTR